MQILELWKIVVIYNRDIIHIQKLIEFYSAEIYSLQFILSIHVPL